MALQFLNNGYFAGEVGIGVESPLTNLDVLGTSDTYVTIRNTGGGNKSGILMYGGSSGISHIWHDDTDANPPGIRFGTSANVATAPTTQVYIEGSSGNVGIGTDNPGSLLHLKGTNPELKIATAADGQTARLGLYEDAAGTSHGGYIQYVGGGDTLRLGIVNSTVNTDVITIKDNFNVGIGTTNPTAAKLVVDSDTAPQILVKNSAGGNAKILFEDNSGLTQNASISFDQGSQNTLTIATGYQSSTDLNRINISPAGNVGLTVRGGTGGSGLGQPLVGIGTTSPIYKLDVDGDIRARSNIRVFGNNLSSIPYNSPSETSVNMGTYINQFAYLDLSSSATGGSWIDFSDASGGDFGGRIRYNNGNDQFQFFTNTTQRMTISSTGLMQFNAYGAGTLVTDASGNITSTTTPPGTGVFLPLTGGTLTGAFYAEGSLPTTPGMSGTGIGLGQASNYAHAQFSGSAGGYIDFSEPNVDWAGRIIYTHSSDSMVFWTATTAVLTLDSSNNATFTGDITVSGGDITLGGTGRIQGIDTVSDSTDAANKAYVDASVPSLTNYVTLNTAQTITAAKTFTADVNVGAASTNGAGVHLMYSTTHPEIRIQAGENGTDAFTIYNTATNPDAVQFFINNNLGSSHLGNARGALKLESSSGVVLTLSGSNATFAGDLTVSGGDITLGGTGRIQGIDTVSASTDAASKAYVDGSIPSLTNYVTLDTVQTITGSKSFTSQVTIDTAGGSERMRLYNENNTAPIADTFSGNTSKSYIYFDVVAGNNDPGFVMHESSATETNEGVLHLVPSDDNATNDYVSIHGTNDPDAIRLHTSGLIETGSNIQLQIKSGSGNLYLNDSVDIANNLLVSGTATITSDLTVNGGDITLGGTGRIQGIDTVTDATDAANKAYVDNIATGSLKFISEWSAAGTAGGSPDLRLAATHIPGNYYIVSVAGSATPNGAGTLPNEWGVGDWCIRADLTTDTWQKIDNTQVGNVTGSGSSGRVAYWNSNSNITSDADLTFDGSNLTVGGNLTVAGNQYFNGEFIEGDGKEMFRYNDGWLRINEDNDFGSGIYCGTGLLRTDGAFQIGGSGTYALITAAGAASFRSISTIGTLTVSGNTTLSGTTNTISGNTLFGGYTRLGGRLVNQYIANLSASGQQARQYEIARAFMDYNDWNSSGIIKINVMEQYYDEGIGKEYAIRWGYNNTFDIDLINIYGGGDLANGFECVVGTLTQIGTSDIYYLPIIVKVRYYSQVGALITTNRNLTTNASSTNGGVIYINPSPTAVNISDFSVVDSVEFSGPADNINLGTAGTKVGIGFADSNLPTQGLDVNVNTRLRGTLYDVNNAAGSAGDVLTSTGSGVDWVSPGTPGVGSFLPIANPAFTGTLTGPQVTISGNVNGNQFYSSNNGNGQNYRIGDDAWIGDINIANTFRVQGNQTPGNGYITFGNSSNTQLGRAGTGALTWGGAFEVTTSVTAPTFIGALTGNASTASSAAQVTISYNNNSNANYQMLWGSGNNVYGTSGVVVNPFTNTVTATTFSGALTGNATSASLLNTYGTWTTQGGQGAVNFVYAINNSTTGLFPGSDNSNALLTLSRHPGNYYSQLGFSSNGNLYYRKFSNAAINTTQSWNQIMLAGQGPQGTITGGGQNLRLALWDGSSSIGSDADFTYNGDTIFTTKLEASTSVTVNSSAAGDPVFNLQQAGTQKASLQFIDGTNTTTDPDRLVLTSVPSSFTINTNSADRIRIDTVGQARIGVAGNKTTIGADQAPTTVLTVFDIQDTSSYSGINIKQYNNPYDNNGFFGMINAVGGTFNIVAKSGGTIKFMDGQSSATNMEISGTGDIKFNNYGAGTLVTDANGNITATTPAADSYINAATFQTNTGVITGTGVGSAGFTVDIDGRYPVGNVANTEFYLALQQNPVGTTYGNGVSTVPTYYFGQRAGDNDGMRFYTESAATNDVTAVWEIIDDIETGLTWLFRNKKTYSPYTATDALKIDGDGDVTVGKDLTVTGGDIVLSGTGRIQGIDTITDSTDAVNKAYVDARDGTVKISGTPAIKQIAEWTSGDTIKGSATLQVNSSGTGVDIFGNDTSGATGILNMYRNNSIGDDAIQFILGASTQNYLYSDSNSDAAEFAIGVKNAANSTQILLNLKRSAGVELPVVSEIGSDTDRFLMLDTSNDNLVKYVTGANLLSYIGGTSSSGVTSVGLTSQGDAIAITGTPVTVSGNLGITFQGDTDEYINGEGDLVSFPNIPQGDITGVTAGTGLTGGGTSGSVTLNVIGGAGLTANANDVAVDYLGTDSIIKAAPTLSAAVSSSDFLLIAASNGNVYETTFSNLPFVSSSDGTYVRTTGNQTITGNKEFAPSSTSTSYTSAAVELRESNYSGSSVAPPRISWHWGGVVASSMTIENNGTIAVRNNPGTAYERFACGNLTAHGGTFVLGSGGVGDMYIG